MHSRWEPTTNICERKFEVDGPRPDLGLDFGGVLRKLSQKHILFWKNLIIEDRRLK